MTKGRYYIFGWICLIMGVSQIPFIYAMPDISDAEAFLNSLTHIKVVTEADINLIYRGLLYFWYTPITFFILLVLSSVLAFKQSPKFIYSFVLSLLYYVYTANINHIIETPEAIFELFAINTDVSLRLAFNGAINNILYPISYITVTALYINHLTRRSSGTREKASRAP